MSITLNGTEGVTLDNGSADGAQVTLKSSGYSDWNLDNYNGRFRAYYNATERFTIDTSGNVGIGTSNPARKLTVQADDTNALSGSNTAQIRIQGNTNSNYQMYIGLDTTTGYGYIQPTLVGTAYKDLALCQGGGNVLIATSSTIVSQAKLQTKIPTSGYARATQVTTNGDYAEVMYNSSGGSVGYIQVNSGGTVYSTTSDYRLKENIQPMVGALDKVAQLNPVTYTWIADGSEGQGFIAHELQAVVPDCVTGEKDAVDADGNPFYQGIDTSFLVATLTAAIQEQQELINTLTSRIEALESK